MTDNANESLVVPILVVGYKGRWSVLPGGVREVLALRVTLWSFEKE